MRYRSGKNMDEKYSCIFNEADLALKDKSRVTSDSQIAEQILRGTAASLLVAGGAVTTSSLIALSGISAAAMLTPLTFHLFLFYGVGRLIKKKSKDEKMLRGKMLAYKQAIAKQNAIIKALKEETNASKERIEYLIGINRLLQDTIVELQGELKQYM